MHKLYNFKILGMGNFHLPLHPADLSYKDSEPGIVILYIKCIINVNFKTRRIKDFGSDNSTTLRDAPFDSSPELFSYFQLASFSPNLLPNHILHHSQGICFSHLE